MLHMVIDWVTEFDLAERDQLRDLCYEPGLLAKLLGFSVEPLRTVSSPGRANLCPDVEFVGAVPKQPDTRLSVTNRGGGIGRMAVFLNGEEVIADARPTGSSPGAAKLGLDIDLSDHPAFASDVDSVIEVRAYNADGYLAGRGVQWKCPAIETATGAFELEKATEIGPAHLVNCVAFSADGSLLANGNQDMNIELRDVKTGRLLQKMQGHGDAITAVAFSPDRRTLASGGRDGDVRLWATATGALVHSLTGLPGQTVAITFRFDKGLLIGGNDDGTIVLWDMETGKRLRVLRTLSDLPSVPWERWPSVSRALAFSPDARRVAVGHPFGVIRIYDLTTSNMLSSFEVSAETSLHSPSTIAFDPTGSTVAIGCALSESTLRVLGMLAGGEIQLSGHGNVRIPQETTRCQIQLRDAQSGKVIRLLSAHQHAVTAVTFSDNGRLFASAGSDRMIRVWDVETEQLIEEVETDFDSARHLAFSPDGTTLASGEGKHPFWGRIVLWDIESGQKRIL